MTLRGHCHHQGQEIGMRYGEQVSKSVRKFAIVQMSKTNIKDIPKIQNKDLSIPTWFMYITWGKENFRDDSLNREIRTYEDSYFVWDMIVITHLLWGYCM